MSAVSHTYNAVMSPRLSGIYLFFPIKSAQCLFLQGATSSLIPRHQACKSTHHLAAMSQAPWAQTMSLQLVSPLQGLTQRRCPVNPHWFTDAQYWQKKLGSALSVSFLKIFSINPRDAGRSWQPDQKQEKWQENLEFRELCLWQDKYIGSPDPLRKLQMLWYPPYKI